MVFNKSMYHRLTTLKLTEAFSLMVSKLLLKIIPQQRKWLVFHFRNQNVALCWNKMKQISQE